MRPHSRKVIRESHSSYSGRRHGTAEDRDRSNKTPKCKVNENGKDPKGDGARNVSFVGASESKSSSLAFGKGERKAPAGEVGSKDPIVGRQVCLRGRNLNDLSHWVRLAVGEKPRGWANPELVRILGFAAAGSRAFVLGGQSEIQRSIDCPGSPRQ
jgi:hypothetical protein